MTIMSIVCLSPKQTNGCMKRPAIEKCEISGGKLWVDLFKLSRRIGQKLFERFGGRSSVQSFTLEGAL